MDKKNLIENVPCFYELDSEALDILAGKVYETSFKTGTIIFNEGEDADRLYIVSDGVVEILKNDKDGNEVVVGVHTKGNVFGEMAILDNLPRSGTARTRTPVKALYLEREDFLKILDTNPSVNRCMMKSLSGIIRTFNEVHIKENAEYNKRLKTVLEELKKMQKEALYKERLYLMGQSASQILHDIRNPLSVLKTQALLLGTGRLSSSEKKKACENIISTVSRMENLTTEFMDFIRGDIKLDYTVVGARQLGESLSDSLADKFAKKNVRLEIEYKNEFSAIVDEGRILRCLINLIENALKAVDRDRGIVSVVFDCKNEVFSIEITDNGCGIPEEKLSRIFQPFFSESEGGTGLGLQIVQSIVKAHNGEILVKSVPGKGTTFTMMIPCFTFGV